MARNWDLVHNQCSAAVQGACGGVGVGEKRRESKRDQMGNMVPANRNSDLLHLINTFKFSKIKNQKKKNTRECFYTQMSRRHK